ncbi:MAG: FAD-binding protein [candidate division KSB1 bacterium]|nr:FAD-binding protein [candidate division KSB1 bacterium]
MNLFYDYIVIGSGFGGSVAAMRLAEKGYSVLVLEQGKRYRNEDFPKTNWSLHKYIWAPRLRWFGFQKLSAFKEVFILSGVGVGGGSLVYAATHMFPPDAFFQNPVWAHYRDWKTTLMPFYEKARFMLGSTRNPAFYRADELLQEIAAGMEREAHLRPRGCRHLFRRPRAGNRSLFQRPGPDAPGLCRMRRLHGGLPLQREKHAG